LQNSGDPGIPALTNPQKSNNADSETIDEKLFGTTISEPRISSEIAGDAAADVLGGMVRTSVPQPGYRAGKTELVEWAKSNGRLISKLPFRLNGPKDVGVGEHHVFLDEKAGRVVKITKGNGDGFGNTLDLSGKRWGIGRATALQYLQRIRLSNEKKISRLACHSRPGPLSNPEPILET